MSGQPSWRKNAASLKGSVSASDCFCSSNHRIGNSLATVSSLLGLQLRQTRSEEARSALSAARDRVQTVSTAHRRLRLGEDIKIDAYRREFLETVIEDIRNAIGEDRKISFRLILRRSISRPVTSRPLALFWANLSPMPSSTPSRGRQEGQIAVSFRYDGETGIPALIVEDNGVGWRRRR